MTARPPTPSEAWQTHTTINCSDKIQLQKNQTRIVMKEQHEESVSVSVAGLQIEIRAVGCRLTDVGFRGFGTPRPSRSWMPPPTDIIVVTLTQWSNINDGAKANARFVSPKNGEDGCEWALQSNEDGTETITARYDNGPLKAAQVTYTATNAQLRVEPAERHASTIDPYIFPIFNIFLSRQLLRRGGFLIHSSVVCTGIGKGMLFTAPSGTGKSTIAELFRKDRAVVINDDMVAVRPPETEGGEPRAYSIPMRNYKQKPSSTTLRGVYLLHQAPENTLAKIKSKAEAMAAIMANVIQQPLNEESVSQLTSNVFLCFGNVDTSHLGFEPSGAVVKLLRGTMSARAKKGGDH